jgi:Tol biopolymer transport system component
LKSEGRKRARSLAKVGIALALTLILVAVAVNLPSPPGTTATPLNYQVVTAGSWNDVSPAWSPDGKTIAYSSDQNGVWQIFTMSPDGTSNRAITPTSFNATDPSWSPNSKAIAFWSQAGSQQNLRVVFIANSTIRTIAAMGTSPPQGGLGWSPDGRYLSFFVTSNVTKLMSYDFATNASTPVAAVAGGDVSACWVSQTEVVYSSLVNGSYQLLWADERNGTQGVILAGNSSFNAPVFAPASSTLAYISDLVPSTPYEALGLGTYNDGDYNIWAMTLDGSDTSFQHAILKIGGVGMDPHGQGSYPVAYTPGTIGPVQDLAWSPDGTVIAYVAVDKDLMPQVHLWEAFQAASTMGPLASGITNSTAPTWAPDGGLLAFASASGGFYHIEVVNATNLVKPLPPELSP